MEVDRRQRKSRCDRRLAGCARGQGPCPRHTTTKQRLLSWPRPNDKKRSRLGPEPHPASRLRGDQVTHYRWANVGFRDILAHHYLSTAAYSGRAPSRIDSPLHFTLGLSWTPTKLDSSQHNLLQYFQLIVATAIVCDVGSEFMLGVIMRLAFRDDSDSSKAVLYAALAVASLLRHGPDADTIGLQGAALRALQRSASEGITGSKVVQHVTAGMLLCSFEIHGHFKTPGPWFSYVSSAKQLIKSVTLDQQVVSSEFFGATGWLYHHDVTGQLGLRHWRRKERWPAHHPHQAVLRDNTQAMTAIVQKISGMTGYSSAPDIVLWPLADIFENIVDSSHPQYHDIEYRKALDALEEGLESILNGKHVSEADRMDLGVLDSVPKREAAILELYRLAGLIYLERASRSFSGTSPKLDAWTSMALELVEKLPTCAYGFPLFIVACEARTDEQRIAVLDCIAKTQDNAPTARLKIVKDMIQSAWTLEDLETERQLDYMTKLDVVISGCETMPSFS